ncbi:retinol dehydrogenase 7-like [Oppia nitens]|uniref:retinol dehydrogenase 7-like n=1 Tax=Oppia nitens TaxID=1686743 RepID=UPI0023DC9B00|nr:retinol dehydrogenase 7-like [Oppia nitens]
MSTNVDVFKHFGVIFLVILVICSISLVQSLLQVIGFYSVVVWLSWQLTKLYQNYNYEQIDSERKAVFITGCDSGFGNLLAKELDSKGFTVFASCLNPDSKAVQSLSNLCSDRLKILKMDVTKDDDIKEAVNFVNNNLQNNDLWAIVNNAGIMHFLPVEWGQEGVDIFVKQMDVNAMGQVRVAKAFLPMLRKTSNSRIINVESLAGRLAMPGISSYAMSKFAVRAFSDCLRNEIKQFDINVVVIEPSVYSTNMTDYNLWINDFQTKWKESPADVRKDYGPEKCDVLHERINAVIASAKDNPQPVIDALINSITNVTPKPYYYIYGLMERIIATGLEALPAEFYDLAINENIYFPLIKLITNKNRV